MPKDDNDLINLSTMRSYLGYSTVGFGGTGSERLVYFNQRYHDSNQLGIYTDAYGRYTPTDDDSLVNKIYVDSNFQNKLRSNNNIIVNNDNTLSLQPSVFNGYATNEYVNNATNDIICKSSYVYGITRVIQIADKVKLLVFRFNFPNNNSTNCYDSFPQEIKNISNVRYIEEFQCNIYKDGALYNCIDCYPYVEVNNGRIALYRSGASSAYWHGAQCRIKMIIIER